MSEEEATAKADKIVREHVAPGRTADLLVVDIKWALIEASKLKIVQREPVPFVFDDEKH